VEGGLSPQENDIGRSVFGCKHFEPGFNGVYGKGIFSMFFFVYVTVAALEVAAGQNMKK
jgi:hypothetical protein